RGACAERLLATAFSKGASGTVVLRAVVGRVDVLEFAESESTAPLARRTSGAFSLFFFRHGGMPECRSALLWRMAGHHWMPISCFSVLLWRSMPWTTPIFALPLFSDRVSRWRRPARGLSLFRAPQDGCATPPKHCPRQFRPCCAG